MFIVVVKNKEIDNGRVSAYYNVNNKLLIKITNLRIYIKPIKNILNKLRSKRSFII